MLSGRALNQFDKTRKVLEAGASQEDTRVALSALRTHLKIDLGVRQPEERDLEMAWPEDERW